MDCFNGYSPYLQLQTSQGVGNTPHERCYVKASTEEDDLMLEAANIYGRNDYQKIIQHVENRMMQLPLLTQNVYRSAKFAQKRERVYRRLKQLINSRKTIEDEWAPARITNVTAAPTAPVPRMSTTSSVVREIENQDFRYLYSMQESSIASPMSIVAASREAGMKDREEKKRNREEREVDDEEDQPKKKQSMKDLRKENRKMMNETLKSFPMMMSSMMEMMERERKEDRDFKKFTMKQMSKGSDDE